MKREQIVKCRKLLWRYRLSAKDKKELARNEIFTLMQPQMFKWICSILSKRKVFISQTELTSLSWDCFMYCLDRYKFHKKITVASHFYTYTRFYLLKNTVGHTENPNEVQQEPEILEELISCSNQDVLYEQLGDIKTFRGLLDKEHQSVFDEAMMSMVPGTSNQTTQHSLSTMNTRRYKESKRIFKIVIDYLLRR